MIFDECWMLMYHEMMSSFFKLPNLFRCPTNLSQYPYSQCYFKDSLKESSGGCYRIRDVPLDDRLIVMDSDLTLNCSESECEHTKTLF